MLGIIVFAAAGTWILVFVLVLGLCNDAKAGDELMEIGPGRLPGGDGEAIVLELMASRRDKDPRQLLHLV